MCVRLPTPDDHIHIFRLELHGCRTSPAFFAGDQSRSRSTKRIEHQIAAPAAISYRSLDQGYWLHRRVQPICFRLWHEPYITFIASSTPEMSAALLPPIDKRLVGALVIRSSNCEPVLGPDQERRPVAAGFRKCFIQR